MIAKKGKAFIVLILSLSVIYGQDQSIADSLKEVYAKGVEHDSIEMLVLFDISFHETNPSEAEKFANLLIAKAAETKDEVYGYRGYLQKGYSKQLLADYDLAFAAFFSALELANEANYMPGIGACYTAIADTYSLSGDSQNAMRYYSRGISVLRGIPDSISLATTLLNAGDEYLNSNQLDSALSLFEESRIIFNLLDYEIGQAYNIGNVGLVYARQGKYDQAEERLNTASKILERLGDIYPIAEYNFSISDIYEERQEITRAIGHARFGYNIASYYGFKKEMKDGAERLSKLYEQKGDLRNSLQFLKESVALGDSMNTSGVIREMGELRRKFDLSQKQAEVDLLSEQKRTQQVIGLAMTVILFLTVVVIVILYLTSKKRKKLNTELALINETKTKFFSIISHDLRSPISAFYGINRVIKHLIHKKRYQDLEDMTDEIDQSVSSISTLLDNLLKWAVQQQGHFSYNPESLSLHRLIEDNRDLLLPVAEIKSIQLNNQVKKSIHVWVDKNSIMTVFRNLISNAIKFTPEKGSVTMHATISGNQVIATIQDTGLGMSEEQLATLFKFSASNSSYGTSGEKGVGLGIQLSHEFVILNKGDLAYESELQKGTTVRVTLPLAKFEPVEKSVNEE